MLSHVNQTHGGEGSGRHLRQPAGQLRGCGSMAKGEGNEGPGGRAGRRARSSPASQGHDLPVTAHHRRLRGQQEETAAAERPRVQTAQPGKELGAKGEGRLLIRGD